MDELLSLQQSQLPFGSAVHAAARDVHPPLYSLLLGAWVAAFGDGVVAVRSLSVLFGALAVVYVFRTALRMAGWRSAGVAAGLCAVCSLQLYYSQEARMYALLAATSAASISYAIDLEMGRVGRRTKAGYAIATLLLVYTHVYGAFLVLAQNFFHFAALATNRSRSVWFKNTWLPLQIVVFVAFLPWLGVLWEQTSRVQGGFWLPPVSAASLGQMFKAWSGGTWTSLVLVALVLYLGWSRHRNLAPRPTDATIGRHPRWLLTSCALGPVAIAIVASLVGQPIFHVRYTIGAAIAVYVLTGVAVAATTLRLGRAVVVMLILVCVDTALADQKRMDKPQWSEVVKVFDESKKDDDIVLFLGAEAELPFQYYWQRQNNGRSLSQFRFRLRSASWDERQLRRTKQILEQPRRIWLFLGGWDGNQAAFDSVLPLLESSRQQLATVNVGGAKAQLWAAPGSLALSERGTGSRPAKTVSGY